MYKNEYQDALKISGYNIIRKFEQNNNRNMNALWYNTPFNLNLNTNIGKSFLKLIDKHFPKQNIN